MIVQWGSCLSNAFFVTNGVRQGRMLSLMLFNIYIDGLSDILNKSTIFFGEEDLFYTEKNQIYKKIHKYFAKSIYT